MAPPAAAAEAPAAGGGGFMSYLQKGLLMYLCFNIFKKMSGSPAAEPAAPRSPEQVSGGSDEWRAVEQPQAGGVEKRRAKNYRNSYPDGCEFDLRVSLSTSEFFDFEPEPEAVVWEERGMTYDWEESNNRALATNITGDLLEAILGRNESVFAHVLIEPTHPGLRKRVITTVHPMIKYRKPRVKRDVKNLLGGDAEEEGEEGGEGEEREEWSAPLPAEYVEPDATRLVPHWKPSLMMHLIHDMTVWPLASIPPQFKEKLVLDEQRGAYLPILYMSEFWLMDASLMEVNHTVAALPLEISYETMGQFKFLAQSQMEEQWAQPGMFENEDGRDHDIIREMLLDTHPALLALTFTVSILHTVFDLLAFKNDIAFWKNNKNVEGLSIRTIGVNIFFQVTILLYLLDNDTSYMIILSSGLGLLIEIWKVRKCVAVVYVEPEGGGPKRLRLEAKGTYAKSKTKEYDEIAANHLLLAAFPLVFGYAVYSLIYQEHKGWYSWVINSLVGFIYMFGFVMMTPQLFINYKLKSVAHLPWRTMTYKALNTFIDDLFAFIIKQPTMHRLACFRDDLIFFVYLYQRYIYPVDKKRVNEFGQCSEPTPEMLAQAKAPGAAAAADNDADASVLAAAAAAPPVYAPSVAKRGKRERVQ